MSYVGWSQGVRPELQEVGKGGRLRGCDLSNVLKLSNVSDSFCSYIHSSGHRYQFVT